MADNSHNCRDCISITACTTQRVLQVSLSFHFNILLLDGTPCTFKTGNRIIRSFSQLNHIELLLDDVDLNSPNHIQCQLCESLFIINTFLTCKFIITVHTPCT